jgi:creatinine amidohydrolase
MACRVSACAGFRKPEIDQPRKYDRDKKAAADSIDVRISLDTMTSMIKPPTRLTSHWWWEHSARDFAGFDMSGFVAILPVAAVEQHGPHLPLQVDAAINVGIVARAVEMMPTDMPVLVLPMMPIGKSNEHISYPGTLSLSYETLARLWIEIGESVLRAGCRKLIIFNSHGGQPQVADIVCRELRVRHKMFAVNAFWARMVPMDDLFSADELSHGIHGGECETSMMLHLKPGLVEMAHAADFVPTTVELERTGGVLSAEGAVGFGWMTEDLEVSGACGNAAAGDATRGREVVERAAAALVRLCTEVIAYPLSKLDRKTAYHDG